MHKTKWLLLLMAVSLFFISCDDGSDELTMNEDYAGTWYSGVMNFNDGFGDQILIYSFTDTTLSISTYIINLGMEVEVEIGTVRKISDSLLEYQSTQEYDSEQMALVDSNADPEEVEYSVSDDKSTLIYDGMPLSDTDPR
ncbi:MAG: hypothetical protein PQJ58_01740 [Spirochaetales bacterium]|nr:hypothetical protein [Spirochaetales bacterium]